MVAVSFKKARSELSTLLDRVEKGEPILILRRGRKVAQLIPLKDNWSPPPSLKEFRKSIRVAGKALSKTVAVMRSGERF